MSCKWPTGHSPGGGADRNHQPQLVRANLPLEVTPTADTKGHGPQHSGVACSPVRSDVAYPGGGERSTGRRRVGMPRPTLQLVGQSHRPPTLQAGGRPPRCSMVFAESAESRRSPLQRVASRAWIRRPGQGWVGRHKGGAANRGDRAVQNAPDNRWPTHDCGAISGPLASVTRGHHSGPPRAPGQRPWQAYPLRFPS